MKTLGSSMEKEQFAVELAGNSKILCYSETDKGKQMTFLKLTPFPVMKYLSLSGHAYAQLADTVWKGGPTLPHYTYFIQDRNLKNGALFR